MAVHHALVAALALLPATAGAENQIGATSDTTLPFARDVYRACWSCAPYLEPGEVFARANPHSAFNDPATMAKARASAAALAKAGVVPFAGQQRWQETYAASFPDGTFPAAPAPVRARNFSADPAFAAWRDFIAGHRQYWDIAADGGTMPPAYRAWGGQWGHISPPTPLDPADCPSGMAACTWGDLYADRWAAIARLTGATGIGLSDFADSQPHFPANRQDFNPRLTAAFAQASGLAVPPGDVPTQARWIVGHAMPAWNDFWAQSYGAFYRALAERIAAATGAPALVIDQCSHTPARRRWVGTDARILARSIGRAAYLCIWDDHVIQSDRPGPVAAPPMQELAGFAVAAAREPLIRNGADLEADDAAYRAAIARFYPTLNPAEQVEAGQKLLKRLWLWAAWAHIADRDGQVRRALAFVSRDYWDAGRIDATLAAAIRSIRPARPFGPALYYSTAIERAREQAEADAAGIAAPVTPYLEPPLLQAFLDAGGGFGYYVSDAALPRIERGAANAPCAWVLLDARGTLPDAERARLAAIAPVVETPAALAALPDQKLGFTGGLTGFGFYDQTGRLILVVSNPATSAAAAPLSGSVALSGLSGPAYAVADLFAGTASPLAVANGKAVLPLSVARWDTRVLVITAR